MLTTLFDASSAATATVPLLAHPPTVILGSLDLESEEGMVSSSKLRFDVALDLSPNVSGRFHTNFAY